MGTAGLDKMDARYAPDFPDAIFRFRRRGNAERKTVRYWSIGDAFRLERGKETTFYNLCGNVVAFCTSPIIIYLIVGGRITHTRQ